MNIQSKPTAAAPHIKAQSIPCGTLVTTDIKRARRMYEEVMGMDCVEPEKGVLLVREKGHKKGEPKHGEPYWVLEVRETPEVAIGQEMLNHWGFEAPSQAAVDEAFQKLSANKQEYGIVRVQKPFFRNGSYAIYFTDKDTNWWEVEYRAPEILYDALRQKGDQYVEPQPQ
jgi:catechol 2,3-dioxygenase-like lactoylglutathione lyase family enzyme